MFAVIETGGKQYKVAKNDIISVEKLEGEKGAKTEFASVLFVGDEKTATIGAPLIKGAAVTAEIVEQTRDKKIIVFKKKRRHNYRRKVGHKQHKTLVKILDIKQ